VDSNKSTQEEEHHEKGDELEPFLISKSNFTFFPLFRLTRLLVFLEHFALPFLDFLFSLVFENFLRLRFLAPFILLRFLFFFFFDCFALRLRRLPLQRIPLNLLKPSIATSFASSFILL